MKEEEPINGKRSSLPLEVVPPRPARCAPFRTRHTMVSISILLLMTFYDSFIQRLQPSPLTPTNWSVCITAGTGLLIEKSRQQLVKLSIKQSHGPVVKVLWLSHCPNL